MIGGDSLKTTKNKKYKVRWNRVLPIGLVILVLVFVFFMVVMSKSLVALSRAFHTVRISTRCLLTALDARYLQI